MNRTRDFRLAVRAVVCGLILSLAAWAQQRSDEPDSRDPLSGYVMKFERTGGYAGVHDEFWIYPDGRVLNGMGKTIKILPGTVRDWLKAFSTATASERESGISLQSLCMDCFVYRITVHGKGGVRKFTVADPLNRAPKNVGRDVESMRDQLLGLSWK